MELDIFSAMSSIGLPTLGVIVVSAILIISAALRNAGKNHPPL